LRGEALPRCDIPNLSSRVTTDSSRNSLTLCAYPSRSWGSMVPGCYVKKGLRVINMLF
jgi:hypothetical protein